MTPHAPPTGRTVTRDPSRVRAFLGLFHEWHRKSYGEAAPKFSDFWILHGLLCRLDKILRRALGPKFRPVMVGSEDYVLMMADEAKKSGARIDLGFVVRNWKGLAVRIGIKPEWIAQTEAHKTKKKAAA